MFCLCECQGVAEVAQHREVQCKACRSLKSASLPEAILILSKCSTSQTNAVLQVRGKLRAPMSIWSSTAPFLVWHQSMGCMPSQIGKIQSWMNALMKYFSLLLLPPEPYSHHKCMANHAQASSDWVEERRTHIYTQWLVYRMKTDKFLHVIIARTLQP